MNNQQLLKLTKLDVAKNQLETAILLFFERRDEVSVHTLVAAALTVLRDLAEKKGIQESDPYFYIGDPGLKRRVTYLLNKPQNFFKHAISDFKEQLEFNPTLTIYFIIQANGLYAELTREHNPVMNLYNLWFYVEHKNQLKEMSIESELASSIENLVKNLDSNNRKSFLKLLSYFEDVSRYI